MDELKLLDCAARKRVLFAGERIVDRYLYVKPLGRPTKDAIISVEQVQLEEFIGGVQAASHHAMAFSENVHCVEGGLVYTKTRFVELSHHRKLFQFYTHNGTLEPSLPADIGEFDAVVLLDYGHGMFGERSIHQWIQGRYTAVNVQTNSGNYGFNLATKYWSVDYLCVDEDEARLATQNKDGPIEQSIRHLATRAKKVVVTLGRKGAVGWSREDDIVYCPAFTDRVVDTIGAGDAFFAVTALVAEEADMLSLLRIGNAAGATKAQIVGHRKGVSKNDIVGLLQSVPRAATAGVGPSPVRQTGTY
jgi:bifunctional ADP-heptose synthase (sugar kinase/adenylyltransferase)